MKFQPIKNSRFDKSKHSNQNDAIALMTPHSVQMESPMIRIIPMALALLLISNVMPINAVPPPSSISTTETAIRSAYFVKADRRLTLTRITVSQNWALAHWQGKHGGGMVVFKQTDGKWSIVRGTGGTFTYQNLLVMFNIPQPIATDLITRGAPELIDSLPIQVGKKRDR
jgi:hypothetical protein